MNISSNHLKNVKVSVLKAGSLLTIFCLVVYGLFLGVEPKLLLAQSDSDSTNVTLAVTSGIAITDVGNINMGNLSVSTNELAAGGTWNVTTNDVDGYTLAVSSATDAAMQHDVTADEFTDFNWDSTNDGNVTPAAWDANKGSGVYVFGFSAYGDDVSASYGTGIACGTTTIPTDLNYAAFESTNLIQIASSTAPTSAAGTDATVCFAAEQVGVFAPSGSYTATITVTATTQ